MTHSDLQRPSAPLRPPDANGWYVYQAGEEVRCPGPAHKHTRLSDRFCGRYICTVQVGVVCVRVEARLHGDLERRQVTRFTQRCSPRVGCGSPLEIEARLTLDRPTHGPQAAA